MKPRTSRLLMLLIGATLAGCAAQTERSGSAAGSTEAAPTPPPAPAPTPAPERESVNYIDRPLDATPPPPKPAPIAKKNEPLPDFPITKYELPADVAEEEIEDLGTQPDESGTVSYAEDSLAAGGSSVSEPTEYAEEEEEIADLGTQPDESGTLSYAEESVDAGGSSVSEPTEYADEEEEVADLGTQPDESGTVAYAEDAPGAGAATLSDPTEYAEEEEEVADLGTQPDESGTMRFPEDQRAAPERLVSAPQAYADEPAKPAPPPRTVSVSFEAEPLFSFDKSAVRADQRSKLDQLVASLKGTDYGSVSVTGHADRIGPKAYNQKLSERRANAVKSYLVQQGVPASRIATEGRGESEPVTGDTCAKKRGKALISCLEPDRRVDVSVSATKRAN